MMMNLFLFWIYASFIRRIPFLWRNYKENWFYWFKGQCDEYLESVEMPRLVRQSNCRYISLAERLRFIPMERIFHRSVMTKCIQLFRSDLDIEPIPEEPYELMPWELGIMPSDLEPSWG